MYQKRTIGDGLFDITNYILLSLCVVITLYPFLYVFFASISNANDFIQHTGILLKPAGFSTAAYEAVLKNPMVYSGYKNTLIIVVVATAYNIIMTSMGAYVLSRKSFYWRHVMTAMIVFTMFFSGGLIPTFLLVRGLGLYDTIWALIIPGAINTWNLMIMRTSFCTIPESVIESTKIDGAGNFTILFRIVLPLSLPTIAVMILYYGVAHWNSWFNAAIYLRQRELFPLQLVLREILIANSTEDMTLAADTGDREAISETIKYALIMVATIPILCVYPFLQKYFVKGVMIGSVKG